jgi:hypothetical protein
MSRSWGATFGFVAAGFFAASLAGCGLAETTTAAATGAAAEAQQAQEAKTTLNHVKQELDAAARESAQQREDAEKESQ